MAISSKAISPKDFDLPIRLSLRRRFIDGEPAAVADGDDGSKMVGQASGCQQGGEPRERALRRSRANMRDTRPTSEPKASKPLLRIDRDQMLIRVWSNPLPCRSRFREPIPARH
jgi:hypothetical protein